MEKTAGKTWVEKALCTSGPKGNYSQAEMKKALEKRAFLEIGKQIEKETAIRLGIAVR